MTAVKMWVESTSTNEMLQRINAVGRVVIKQHPKDIDDYRQLPTGFLTNEEWMNFETNAVLKSYEFPFGPKEITYSGSALEYREVQRPGRLPLLTATNPKNRTVSLSAVIADRPSGGLASVETDLLTLNLIAAEDTDLSFTHGGVHLDFFVRIVKLTVTSLERSMDGEITRAMVDINFQEVKRVNRDVANLSAITTEPNTPDELPKDDPELEFGNGADAAAGGNTGPGDSLEIVPESHPHYNHLTVLD